MCFQAVNAWRPMHLPRGLGVLERVGPGLEQGRRYIHKYLASVMWTMVMLGKDHFCSRIWRQSRTGAATDFTWDWSIWFLCENNLLFQRWRTLCCYKTKHSKSMGGGFDLVAWARLDSNWRLFNSRHFRSADASLSQGSVAASYHHLSISEVRVHQSLPFPIHIVHYFWSTSGYFPQLPFLRLTLCLLSMEGNQRSIGSDTCYYISP